MEWDGMGWEQTSCASIMVEGKEERGREPRTKTEVGKEERKGRGKIEREEGGEVERELKEHL